MLGANKTSQVRTAIKSRAKREAAGSPGARHLTTGGSLGPTHMVFALAFIVLALARCDPSWSAARPDLDTEGSFALLECGWIYESKDMTDP